MTLSGYPSVTINFFLVEAEGPSNKIKLLFLTERNSAATLVLRNVKKIPKHVEMQKPSICLIDNKIKSLKTVRNH